MKAILKLNNHRIEIKDIKKCRGINKIIGLMFKSKNTNSLLFEFEKGTKLSIHSLFCRTFLAIWIDENNKILEYKLIAPWKINITPKHKFSKLLELPLNEKYKSQIVFFLEYQKV